MPKTFEKITDEALSLPSEKRAELANTLISSLEESVDADVEAAWEEEIEKRVNDIKSGKVSGVPAEEVFAKLNAKYN